MKIYTFYTDSHKVLYDNYFLPSFLQINHKEKFQLITKVFPQECKTGKYMDSGWNNTMRRKTKYIIEAILENWGNYFIHSDCDIQFFKDFYEDILEQSKGFDLVAQDDLAFLCAGFFICKGSDKTKRLFETILKNIDKHENDQFALHNYKDMVKNNKLSRKYFSIAYSVGGVWEGNENVHVPKDIFLHHANWTIGLEDKIKLMNIVRNKVLNE